MNLATNCCDFRQKTPTVLEVLWCGPFRWQLAAGQQIHSPWITKSVEFLLVDFIWMQEQRVVEDLYLISHVSTYLVLVFGPLLCAFTSQLCPPFPFHTVSLFIGKPDMLTVLASVGIQKEYWSKRKDYSLSNCTGIFSSQTQTLHVFVFTFNALQCSLLKAFCVATAAET